MEKYTYIGIVPKNLTTIVSEVVADGAIIDKPDDYDYQYTNEGTGIIKVYYSTAPGADSKTALDSYMSGIGYSS